MTDVVLFEELTTASGHRIGVATLNSEKSLNALSLAMIQQLQPQLQAWQQDHNIVAVWLQGAGEKAFCAGGDIVAMYTAMRAQPGELVAEVADFFSQEYRLDYLIHTFNKPLLVWGHGIVMGGGMGLMNGGSHRIVTERSLLAMPEVTIGLYPDVGATRFLNDMPAGCGLFLGLTGAHLNAADAQFLNLADHFLHSSQRAEALTTMTALEWQSGEHGAANCQRVTEALQKLAATATEQPESQVQAQLATIQQWTNADDVEQVVAHILSYQGDDKWLGRARANLAHGCPLTAHIVWNQLAHGSDLSLADCFRLELTLSTNCAVRGDFAEGIRALLIDKDKQPKWQHENVAAVTAAELDNYFKSPWQSGEHPLADLA